MGRRAAGNKKPVLRKGKAQKEVRIADNAPKKAPTTTSSFVMRIGKVSREVQQLVLDLRRVMEPNTASRLRERHSNNIRDYAAMAGALGVTHMYAVSQGEQKISLRMARFPQGPTLCFSVESFSLVSDVLAEQKRPKTPGLDAFRMSPLLILDGLDPDAKDNPQERLLASFFQNAFPSMQLAKMKLGELRRVVLLSCEGDVFELRHYTIGVRETGVSKPLRRLLRASGNKNLSQQADLADYLLDDVAAGMTSDSEVEARQPEVMVTLPAEYQGQAKNSQRAIQLTEIGPRLTLKLERIQDSFFGGQILDQVQRVLKENTHSDSE